MDVKTLKSKAQGKWFQILAAVGVDDTCLDGKHHPCPICGGTDRFRWDNKDGNGSYFCNQCTPKSNDSIMLIQKIYGLSLKSAIDKVDYVIDRNDFTTDNPTGNTAKTKQASRHLLNELWTTSRELNGSDFVSRYLHSRKLNLTPQHVKWNTQCYNTQLDCKVPAMIAKVTDNKGKPITLHRTYLNLDGNRDKRVNPDKMLMPGTDSLAGTAIRLFKSDGGKLFVPGVLGVAEGIETAMACAQMFGMVTWSLINNVLMESWLPPTGAKNIVIYADNDRNFTGQKSAYVLANKLRSLDLIVKVKTPVEPDTDFADELFNRMDKATDLVKEIFV